MKRRHKSLQAQIHIFLKLLCQDTISVFIQIFLGVTRTVIKIAIVVISAKIILRFVGNYDFFNDILSNDLIKQIFELIKQ